MAKAGEGQDFMAAAKTEVEQHNYSKATDIQI